ncbi:meteorin-like protein [Brachyhypopomus gauderio]|uniref:meteorin-like protein n=1 Tax=Brachyhypopomus gauderio TaxID=698409 RepID=UPI0040422752
MFVALVPVLLCAVCLVRIGAAQYSSDQCNWRGSGLTHESHVRDVEQVYLRCGEGSLEWLYPTGAIIINLRPNTEPPGGVTSRLLACLRPRANSSGASVYVERAGRLRLLLSQEEQAAGRVRCFPLQEGALFVEAAAPSDIGRRVTAFQYELVKSEDVARGESHLPPASCRPCTDEEILMAVCTSDFVVRGSMQSIEEDDGEEQAMVVVSCSRVYRQKRSVFVFAGERGHGPWTGRMKIPRKCGMRAGQEVWQEEEFLFTGAVRLGEAWLGCAPRYKDFLQVYQAARQAGSNPCHIDTD